MAVKARAHESDLRSGNAKPRTDSHCPHPVDLARLIEPYRARGKLSLRLEQLPPRSRFSAGTRVSDRSWSLSPDDLNGLVYLLPEGIEPSHFMTLRVVGLDRGDTLAVMNIDVGDVLVSKQKKPGADDGQDSVKDQLAQTKVTLNSLEGQLAEALAEIERLTTSSGKKAEAGVEAARAAWKEEESVRLASAQRTWKAEEAARIQEINARWQAKLNETQNEPDPGAVAKFAQQKAQELLSEARTAWKAEEASNLKDAEARWKKKLDQAVAQKEKELSQSQTRHSEGEIKMLRETIASLQSSMMDRDTALLRASKALEAETNARRQDAEEFRAALNNAHRMEQERDDEHTRALAHAEHEWKRENSQDIHRLTARAEAAEAALAELRRSSSDTAHLEYELTVLRETLARREAELKLEHEKLVHTTDALHQNEHTPPQKAGTPAKASPSFLREVIIGASCTAATILVLPLIGYNFSANTAPVAAISQTVEEAAPKAVLMQTVSVIKTTRLRMGPSKKDKSLARADEGTLVSLLEPGTEWSRVQMNYKTKTLEGWIENSALNIPEPPKQKP